MVVSKINTSPPEPASAGPGRQRQLAADRAYWCRVILAATWIFLAAAVLVLGEREASLRRLDAALDNGGISSVSVSGEGLGPDGSGYVNQLVHWRDGGVPRITEVMVRSQDMTDNTSGGQRSGTTWITAEDLGTYLQDRHPQLLVTRTSEPRYGGEFLGWQFPGWLTVPGFIVYFGTLGLLISGPEPWRATRWAWFWLWTTPFGTPAFLLLSGPMPLLPPPRRTSRRWTGGWVFLLAAFVLWPAR